MLDHTCPHGIQLDVTIATRHMRFPTNQARLKAALPKHSATPISSIDILIITLAQAFHEYSHAFRFARSQEYMNMICHQHIGVDFTSALTRILTKPIQIVVYSVIETGLAAIAALYQMKGDVR
jgi:hypothetical protein